MPLLKDGYGSIDIENQVFSEKVGVVGTPFTLHYSSDRVAGNKASTTLEIQLSGESVPTSLKQIDLEISVAGQKFEQTFPALPNQSTTFTWDRQDAYGRPVNGSQLVTIRIGYLYDAVYQTPAERDRSFGVLSGVPITGSVARQVSYSVARTADNPRFLGFTFPGPRGLVSQCASCLRPCGNRALRAVMAANAMPIR